MLKTREAALLASPADRYSDLTSRAFERGFGAAASHFEAQIAEYEEALGKCARLPSVPHKHALCETGYAQDSLEYCSEHSSHIASAVLLKYKAE